MRTLLLLILLSGVASAHESWISRGGLKNTAGEWCCGAYDCRSYSEAKEDGTGWIVDNSKVEKSPAYGPRDGTEHIPYDEALPFAPPDGKITICRRPDGSRRCVFGLKPGI